MTASDFVIAAILVFCTAIWLFGKESAQASGGLPAVVDRFETADAVCYGYYQKAISCVKK